MNAIKLFENWLIFLIFLIICSLAVYRWSRRHLYLFAAELPGPAGLPLIGNALVFLGKRKEDLLKTVLKLLEPYTSPLKIWVGPKLVVCIKDPDQLKIILLSSKMSTKSFIYQFLEPFLGNGIFTSSGEIHKSHSKLFQPFFSRKWVEGYSYLFQKHAHKLADNVKRHVDGSEFDLLHYLHDSAFETIMDILTEKSNDDLNDYRKAPEIVEWFYDVLLMRVTNMWLHPDFIYKRTSYFKEQTKMANAAKNMAQNLMRAGISETLKRIELGGELVKNSELRPPSMVEMIVNLLIENPDCLTEPEYVDQFITFFATNQDSQGSAIGFTCMMLGMHSVIQDQVFREIKEVVGNRKNLDPNDISQLNYLEMCIKETMRLFPVGPFIFRDTTEDFKLGEYIIPKDVTVLLAFYCVHRDPKYWEKPTEYYPEHFTAEAVSKRHPYAFLPFSAGPRKCIAQEFAYVNMKIVIATLLLNYKFECNQTLKDLKLMTDISIRPVNGYKLKIKLRGEI